MQARPKTAQQQLIDLNFADATAAEQTGEAEEKREFKGPSERSRAGGHARRPPARAS